MAIFRVMGLFAIIPIAILLTISFFVLFTLRKIETQRLKAFGYVIAALLWVAALLVFSLGVYTVSTGRHPMMIMMQEMIKGQMRGMMGGQMPPMMRGQRQMIMKDKMPTIMHGQTDESVMKR